MLEIVVTSSVLIFGILLLRLIFQQKIPAGIQYALWLLVAVRLVLPLPEMLVQQLAEKDVFQISSPISVMNIVERVEENWAKENQSNHPKAFLLSGDVGEKGLEVESGVSKYEKETDSPDSQESESTFQRGANFLTKLQNLLCQKKIWMRIWYIGIGVLILWQGSVYFYFHSCLKKHRRKMVYQKQDIYLMKGIDSPFLTWDGFFGSAIYIPEEKAGNKQLMEHAVLHEMTHKKHGDLWWSLLRNSLTTIYWFHPLVWLASKVAAEDCELYCDEAVIKSMKPQQKKEYGESLLLLVRKKQFGISKNQFTTNMGNGKREIKKRIQQIAGGVNVKKWQILFISLILLLLVGCTYTQGRQTEHNSVSEYSQREATEKASEEVVDNSSKEEETNNGIKGGAAGSEKTEETNKEQKDDAELLKEMTKKAKEAEELQTNQLIMDVEEESDYFTEKYKLEDGVKVVIKTTEADLSIEELKKAVELVHEEFYKEMPKGFTLQKISYNKKASEGWRSVYNITEYTNKDLILQVDFISSKVKSGWKEDYKYTAFNFGVFWDLEKEEWTVESMGY